MPSRCGGSRQLDGARGGGPFNAGALGITSFSPTRSCRLPRNSVHRCEEGSARRCPRHVSRILDALLRPRHPDHAVELIASCRSARCVSISTRRRVKTGMQYNRASAISANRRGGRGCNGSRGERFQGAGSATKAATGHPRRACGSGVPNSRRGEGRCLVSSPGLGATWRAERLRFRQQRGYGQAGRRGALALSFSRGQRVLAPVTSFELGKILAAWRRALLAGPAP